MALPTLDGQPVTYSHEVNGEMLFELCSVLVRMGLATPELWTRCCEDPLVFAQRSIVNRLGAETVDTSKHIDDGVATLDIRLIEDEITRLDAPNPSG